jgi:putative transposase/transposase-like zinc-binding protein
MSRPPLEVADIIRAAGEAFIERNRHWLRWKHVKVLRAIERCRTAALGGHLDECTRCGRRAISFNSCRDRHCPKCQIAARERWIAARRRELLPTPYAHIVFTLPRRLAPLVLQNKKVLYDLLFRISAETLCEVARNPKHLGAEIGFFCVLHTWSQQLRLHPHVHCVAPAGGLSPDHARWVRSGRNYFLPKKVLRRIFRGKFVDALKHAFQNGQLRFEGNLKLLAKTKIFAAWLRPLHRHDWVVYLKPPFGGPEYVLQYLGRYTHRVAISNHRLVSLIDGQVTFRWRDSAHGNKQELLPLSVNEFLSRFLLHILPQGFVRIRHFGFLANRRRTKLLPLCLQLLGATPEPLAEQHASSPDDDPDLYLCPNCGGPMKVIERLTAAEIQLRSPPVVTAEACDDSL